MEEKTFDELMELPEVVAEPIVVDFTALKNRLVVTLEDYKNIAVTEETLSIAKKKQKEMASMRSQLDDFRKTVKRAYTEPLEMFESQIKSLIQLVNDTEKILKDDIQVFDDKRREEKKRIAELIIDELVGEYGLNEKYAGQIELKKKYMNLTAKEADIRADVEAQVMSLKQQQDNEESIKKTIVAAVEMQNKGITAKLIPDVYISLIGKLPTDEIIDRILKRGEEIQTMEREAEHRKTVQEAVIQPESEEKPEQEEQEREQKKTTENGNKDIYKVTYCIVGNAEQMQSVSKFLKDNGISYSVESQFIIS